LPGEEPCPPPSVYNQNFVQSTRISALLRPFLDRELAPTQLDQISTYLDLLLRWNQRVNLTAIREPEEIVTRHIGESLFAARHLFPSSPRHSDARDQRVEEEPAVSSQGAQSSFKSPRPLASQAFADDRRPPSDGFGVDSALPLVDIGSGAGFPGLPIKIWSPPTPVTLVESRHKKVAFLREVIRALILTDVDVYAGRAEDFPEGAASIVTLRAVERFEQVLPVAAARLARSGTIALLIGEPQIQVAARLLPHVRWQAPFQIPQSSSRSFLLGRNTIS